MNRSASLQSYWSNATGLGDSPTSTAIAGASDAADCKLGRFEEIIETHSVQMKAELRAWLHKQNDDFFRQVSAYSRQLSKDSREVDNCGALPTLLQSTPNIPTPLHSSRPQDAMAPACMLLASDIEQPNESTGFHALRLPEIVSPNRLGRQPDPKISPISGLFGMREEMEATAEAQMEAGGNRLRGSSMSMSSTLSLLTWSTMMSRGCCGPNLRQVVDSMHFELFFGLLILTNSALIGVAIQWQALHRTVDLPDSLHIVSAVYNALFVLELCLRLCAYGCKNFFCSSGNWRMNWFDTVIVLTILPEFVMPMLGVDTSRSLQTLIHSIMSTLRDLFWAMLLLAMLIYMFAVLFTEVVNHKLATPGEVSPEEHAKLVHLFGDLQLSIHTLFMSIAGGLSWVEATDALVKVGWTWVYIFTCYVAFSLFAVLNVMTGVFCNSAIKGAEKDQEMATQALMVDKHHLKAGLTKLFNEMDKNADGSVSYKEFKHCLEDERVKTLFEAMELGAGDAKQLFKILDVNKDDSVGVEEFLEGCTQVRGNARAIDLFTLSTQTRKLRKQLSDMCVVQRHLLTKLDQVSMKLRTRSHLV